MNKNIKNIVKLIRLAFVKQNALSVYRLGERLLTDKYFIDGDVKNKEQKKSVVKRTDVINYLLSFFETPSYLEIGVRNPDHNYNKVNCELKYGVDPGLEFGSNPVKFKMTSDIFFNKLTRGHILEKDLKFDVIFIDGLHLADQVERDISNSLKHLSDNGFIVLHDCNPPTEFHASETYDYRMSPSQGAWNGTTWKAFAKYRKDSNVHSCCVDTDWGIGVISKNTKLANASKVVNPYFEYFILSENRIETLGLVNFETFCKMIDKNIQKAIK